MSPACDEPLFATPATPITLLSMVPVKALAPEPVLMPRAEPTASRIVLCAILKVKATASPAPPELMVMQPPPETIFRLLLVRVLPNAAFAPPKTRSVVPDPCMLNWKRSLRAEVNVELWTVALKVPFVDWKTRASPLWLPPVATVANEQFVIVMRSRF